MSVAHADVAIANADKQRAEDEVALNVKKLYYNLLAIGQRRHAAESRIRAGEEKLTEARNAVHAGAALQVAVGEGTAQINEARHALGSLEDTDEDLRTELNDLLGLPLETQLEQSISDEDTEDSEVPTTASDSVDDLAQIALVHNPDVSSARGTLQKATAGLDAARLEFVPDVSVFVEHVYQNGVPLLPESSATVGLRLNWTLSEFGKRTGQVRERKSQVAQAEENLRMAESRLRIDIAKQMRKLHRCVTALESAQANVAARSEMRRIVADRVEAKTANESDLGTADAKLDEARAQLFEAKMERAITMSELERLLGCANVGKERTQRTAPPGETPQQRTF